MEGSSQSEFLTSDELAQHSKLEKLPSFKVKEKKYLLYDPAEEKALLDKFFNIHEQVLNKKKVARIKDVMHADWDDRLKRAVTDQIKGKITQHMGYSADGKFYFTPEETVFLIEIGSLELCYGKMPLSAEEAYALVLSDPLSVEKYLVYSSLSRSGYVVVKHNKELNVSTAERLDDCIPEKRDLEPEKECNIDDEGSCSSHGSQDENVEEQTNTHVSSVTCPTKDTTSPQDVDGVSPMDISDNGEGQKLCQGENEDHCSETVIMDVSDGTRSSSCISRTLNESNDAGDVHSAEHSDLNFRCLPLTKDNDDDSVESHIIVQDEAKRKLMFDDDSLGSGKLVIVEQDEIEVDVTDSTNGDVREPLKEDSMCSSHTNNHATSHIANEVTNESITSAGDIVDSSNSNTVHELSGEKDCLDSSNSDEEINVEHISSVERECDENSNSSEKEFDQKNTAENEQMSPVHKSGDEANLAEKDAEKANSAEEEIIDVEQIDSSDDESVGSKKQDTRVSESSDVSSDVSSHVLSSDSSDDSSDSEDSDKGNVAQKRANSKHPVAEETKKNFHMLSSGNQNSENAGNEVDDSDIVFLEVKPKESKPLAVIDLLSGSDSEDDNKSGLVIAADDDDDDDDDDVLIIGEESKSGEMQDRQTRKHLTKKEKKEKSSNEKQQEELPPKKASFPVEWPFPDFAGRTVVCLPRPPSHLLPPNVRPNKEAYPIDTAMFSRSNGSFEKQSHRRDWNSDWRNRSFDNYNVPLYKRQYRRSDTQRSKSTFPANFADRSIGNVHERNKGNRSDDDSRPKKKYKDQMTPQHQAHSTHYRDSANYDNQDISATNDQGRVPDRPEDDRTWAHSVLSRHLDRNVSNQNSNDELEDNICRKRRYEEQRQKQQFSYSTNSKTSFRNNSHWGPIEEFDDGNSRVSSTSKSDNYRSLMMESQKFDGGRDIRFSGRFSDSRFPLDLRPDVARNLHLRHDEVSSSSSPVYNENRDFSPHRQHLYHSLIPHSSSPHHELEHYNQRQSETSRPYERPCDNFRMGSHDWNRSNHNDDSARHDSPYTDVLNLCMQRSSRSPNPQDGVQSSSFQIHQKPRNEQRGKLDNFYGHQDRSVQNLNSEWNEGNKIMTAAVEFSFRAERAILDHASPRLLENTYDSLDANYQNKVDHCRKFPRLDSSVSERRKVVLSSEVGSPHHAGDPELTRGGNSGDSSHLSHSPLPVSLLEMIESAKNPSSHRSTLDGSMTNEEHSCKRKYGEMVSPVSSYTVEQNLSHPTDFCNEAQSSSNKNSFISIQAPNVHSSSYASNENDPVMAQNEVNEVDCSDERDYPHKRRVVIEGTSGLSVHAQSNTNCEPAERTFEQHPERFLESRSHWESGRSNFRNRDGKRFEGDRWRGGNQNRRSHRPQRYQGGSYHYRRQHHGPTKATYYPSAIEKLPDRISSWSEYWSTLKRLEHPEGVAPTETSVPVDEILWSKDIQPLVKPGIQYPVADVLSSLRITQCLNLIKMENLCDRFLPRTCSMEISFDVYLPGTKYSKKSPGTPSHRIVVTRSTDPFPKLAEVVSLQKKFSDMALLQFAVIDCGEIAFYSLNDISLPTLLPPEDAD